MLSENQTQHRKILHDHKFKFQKKFVKFNEYIRGIFIIQPNIYDSAFYKKQLKDDSRHLYLKNLYLRCLAGLLIHLCIKSVVSEIVSQNALMLEAVYTSSQLNQCFGTY